LWLVVSTITRDRRTALIPRPRAVNKSTCKSSHN
jgi:hypothetical protein